MLPSANGFGEVHREQAVAGNALASVQRLTLHQGALEAFQCRGFDHWVAFRSASVPERAEASLTMALP